MASTYLRKFSLRCVLPAVLLTAAAAAPAAADSGADFELQVTWKTLSFPQRHTCDPTGRLVPGGRGGPHRLPECGEWERVNASMSVEGGQPVSLRVRNLGTWNRGPRSYAREENWSSNENPDYPVFIGTSAEYNLADRPLCQTDTYRHCQTIFAKGNNTVTIRGKFGESIRFGVHAQTTDGGDCRVADHRVWDQQMVDRHVAGNPRHFKLTGSICSVRYEAVARRL